MHAVLSSMFGWLRRHRRIEVNPVSTVDPPDPSAARDRVLSDAELVKLWRAAEEIGPPFGLIYKLLVCTGCRLERNFRNRIRELSEDGATLRLPATRTKNKRAHEVPLSPLARSIIAAVPRIESPFVFTTTGGVPVSGFSKNQGADRRAHGHRHPAVAHARYQENGRERITATRRAASRNGKNPESPIRLIRRRRGPLPEVRLCGRAARRARALGRSR